MTFGPTHPSSTGSSIDFSLLLSVSVIVPLCAPTLGLLPSMDAPRSLRPRAIPECGENKPPLADYQMAPQYCNAISQLRDHLDPATSSMRPSVSSRPSTSMTSKIPGDAVEPVK